MYRVYTTQDEIFCVGSRLFDSKSEAMKFYEEMSQKYKTNLYNAYTTHIEIRECTSVETNEVYLYRKNFTYNSDNPVEIVYAKWNAKTKKVTDVTDINQATRFPADIENRDFKQRPTLALKDKTERGYYVGKIMIQVAPTILSFGYDFDED